MNFCTICNSKFTDIEKHLKENHKYIPEEKENKGNNECPLCNVRVANLWQHYFSDLHRYNNQKRATPFRNYSLNEYQNHYDKFAVDKEIFLGTAKEELTDENYKKLEEYIEKNGRKSIHKYTRHSGRSRFSRTYKGIKNHN